MGQKLNFICVIKRKEPDILFFPFGKLADMILILTTPHSIGWKALHRIVNTQELNAARGQDGSTASAFSLFKR